ncbi:MAG: hypothetical protein LQ344_002901 [Seirophora lacunosa]|nr:MAG: hypothetical protein LQ344_002901 [Seirophora lacunosa]
MTLVSYSESSGSETEEQPKPRNTPKSKLGAGKPTFQKVVDRSNPHKIRVNLPEPAKEQPVTEDKQDEDGQSPPAKRAKTGGGAFGAFNSFLPAPKRSAAANGTLASRRGGLGSGVNLKTGATPGFSRDALAEPVQNTEESADTGGGDHPPETSVGPPASTNTETNGALNLPNPQTSTTAQQEEPKKQGNAMMFKPLSVARKPPKKKPIVATSTSTARPQQPTQPKPTPNLSLFSSEPSHIPSENPNNTSTYEPMLYSTTTPSPPPPSTKQPPPLSPPPLSPPQPQTLSTIATDLNLSASAKRQLLGRHPSSSSVKITHFNTDAEYAANNTLLREQSQQQQQQQHNPVRAIAPGKHSLKQLVSAASGQKEALEEQFASGRRNRKEAGGRYGW